MTACVDERHCLQSGPTLAFLSANNDDSQRGRTMALLNAHTWPRNFDGLLGGCAGGHGRPPRSSPNLVTSLFFGARGSDDGCVFPMGEKKEHPSSPPLLSSPPWTSESISETESESISESESESKSKSKYLSSSDDPSSSPSDLHPPLRFVFAGYSLWLELEQRRCDDGDGEGGGDLDRALTDCASEFRVRPIPTPHVTALYGLPGIRGGDDDDDDDSAMVRLFREGVPRVLRFSDGSTTKGLRRMGRRKRRDGDGRDADRDDDEADAEEGGCEEVVWPDLEASGVLVGAAFDGVDGEEMDMAWGEITFKSSPEHERRVDALRELFRPPTTAEAQSDLDSPSAFAAPSEDDRNNNADESKNKIKNIEEKKGGPQKGTRACPQDPSTASKDMKERALTAWLPHLSLVYDNPEMFLAEEEGGGSTEASGSPWRAEDGGGQRQKLLSREAFERFLGGAKEEEENINKFSRAVTGIALWKTEGTMSRWRCLDRMDFQSSSSFE